MEKPQWIWIPGGGEDKNEFVCFRRSLPADRTLTTFKTLQISADSRYFLYLNGQFYGTGPGRCWPQTPWMDSYSLDDAYSRDQNLHIAVLVWHYGTSTSQYIHDTPGLSVRIIDESGKTGLVTDGSWKCARHSAYRQEVPRINISQPWMEDFDSRAFPYDWMMPDFYDAEWLPAQNVSSRFKSRIPRRSRIPLLQSEIKTPAALLRQRTINSSGQGIRIDYREAFYPGDTSTEDKLHIGFLVTCLLSAIEQSVTLTLLDRKWPLEIESIYVNGILYEILPEKNEVSIPLQKGDNLFTMDLSGAWQRLWVDLHFQAEAPLTFASPLPNMEIPFAAFGPIESISIGNIVCSDGYDLDKNHPDYRSIQSCGHPEELIPFKRLVSPGIQVFQDLPKHLSFGAVPTSPDFKELSPVRKIIIPYFPSGDGELLLDMGEEVSGFLELTLESQEEATLDILFFEYLKPGDIPEIPADLDTSLRLTTGGCPVRFRSVLRRGFRYMLVIIRSEAEVILSDLQVDQSLYPFTVIGSFSCSDPTLNMIDEICVRTLKLCREDSYVDSPAFEQALWLGDVKAMAGSNNLVFGDIKITENSLLLAADSLKETSLPDCHLPAGIHLQLTAWSLFWILTATEHISGNPSVSFEGEIYPALSQTLYHFISLINPDGLLETAAWNMLDWGGMETPYRGLIAHQNALLVKALVETAALPSALKRDRKTFTDTASSLRRAINHTFWSEDHHAYRDCMRDDGSPSPVFSIPTNLMMLYSHCVTDERQVKVKEFVLNPPEGTVLCGSPFLAGFLLDFLFQEGFTDQALNQIRTLWGSMLEEGSTTCWETFKGFYKDRLTRSYCHGWSCMPAELFRRYILGFTSTPGKHKVNLISPQPGTLKAAEGTIPLPEGLCSISWQIRDNLFDCTVIHPSGYEALIRIPEGLQTGRLELREG
ncbi:MULTISPECIES: trehalase family glycosidase [unclassified Oceanispirochaeta]|uniref:alpha-L-rhamnosidase-related protein n=1 Tax=unclassified Oceanispirochaeta TaxID=2635722 RepID=UPI000E09B7BF|nr:MULTISPECIES: trehalase family glycosidase [unclassified Oceanispirochaeta]MBF9017601.1 family 78 glycoside hydrolase catalytic domain [Oceanispirochaeta sp. M2]NPD74173.1 family 78 glycoside hydrolase catalytic domain [Oceanispirochaeta sp. M1]RDG29986.1 hypothetical protein DV872_18915 [Oceanispirochaeta sp. M1]